MLTKKLGFPQYLVAFLICAILGGWASFRLLSNLSFTPQPDRILVQNPANIIATTVRLQNNFVLIEVDHLTNPQPSLISIWAVFTLPSTPAFITFKQLYPSVTEPDLSAALQQEFLLNGEKRPSQEFLHVIIQRIQMDGVIIVDQTSFDAFDTWLKTQTDAQQTISQNTGSASTLLLFCELVNQNVISDEINWGNILTDHFSSDINIDLAVKNWKALSQDGENHHCEVIQ